MKKGGLFYIIKVRGSIFLIFIILSTYFLYLTHLATHAYSVFLIYIANILTLVLAYMLNNLTDQNEDSVNGTLLKSHNKDYTIKTCVLFLIPLFMYMVPGKLFIFLLGFLLICLSILYSFPPQIRLKRFFILKNIVPAFCWFLSLVLIISSNAKQMFPLEVVLPLYHLFMIFFIIEVIWDIPDKNGDKLAHIKTLPTVFGNKRTKIILVTCLFILTVLSSTTRNTILYLAILIFVLCLPKNINKDFLQKYLYLFCLLVTLLYLVSFLH